MSELSEDSKMHDYHKIAKLCELATQVGQKIGFCNLDFEAYEDFREGKEQRYRYKLYFQNIQPIITSDINAAIAGLNSILSGEYDFSRILPGDWGSYIKRLAGKSWIATNNDEDNEKKNKYKITVEEI